MEVSGIDNIQTLTKILKKESLQLTRAEDSLCISTESQKKADWVEKLKQMPDVRPEKIDAALGSDAFLNPTKVFAEVVRQLLNS